jgi:hypothetical protein
LVALLGSRDILQQSARRFLGTPARLFSRNINLFLRSKNPMSMSAPALAVPDSVQQKTTQQPKEHNTFKQDIANLAYALWQQRGCPQGASAEQDWFEAEERMRAGR